MIASGDHHGRPAAQPVVQEDARLAHIVRSSPDPIVGATLDGLVTIWNRAAEQLFGYRSGEIIGSRAELLYPPDCRAREAVVLRRLARGERIDQYATEWVRRDGTTVPVRLTVFPVTDDEGTIVGVASMARRTAAVRDPAEGRLPAGSAPEAEQVSRPQVVLPARTGHELRTPLQAVIGFTGTLLLRLPGPLNEEQERQLVLVQESARQLLSMINQLSRPADV
jgi:PAS domain S-box-containing protein